MKEVLNVREEVNTTNYVDVQTGEVIDEQKTEHRSVMRQKISNKRADLFFNIYYESGFFTKMLSLSRAEQSTLMACASAAQAYTQSTFERFAYHGNMVVADAKFRRWVCESSNLADSSVKEALGSLVRKGFMLRDQQAKGIYYLNAEIIFKGYSNIRTRVLNAPIYSDVITVDDLKQAGVWTETAALPESEPA